MATLRRNLTCACMLVVIVFCIISINQMLLHENNTYISDLERRYDQQIVLENVRTEYKEVNGLLLNGPSVSMDDPRVIARLRRNYLVNPPPANTPMHLSHPEVFDTSMGQAAVIRTILSNKRNGFFIECGALDGETRSNSLIFEKELDWTGLLIEADPKNFQQVMTKNRQAYLSPTCLSTKPYPMMVSFHQAFNIGKISNAELGSKKKNFVDVQCFPLYSYLLALNRTTIDYFSLDVEGNELEVLENIPFDKVDIRTLSVEFIHGTKGKDVLQNYMEEKGYLLWGEVKHPMGLANDFIFYKKVSEI